MWAPIERLVNAGSEFVAVVGGNVREFGQPKPGTLREEVPASERVLWYESRSTTLSGPVETAATTAGLRGDVKSTTPAIDGYWGRTREFVPYEDVTAAGPTQTDDEEWKLVEQRNSVQVVLADGTEHWFYTSWENRGEFLEYVEDRAEADVEYPSEYDPDGTDVGEDPRSDPSLPDTDVGIATYHLRRLVGDGAADEAVLDDSYRVTVDGEERALDRQESAVREYRSRVSDADLRVGEAFAVDGCVTVRYELVGTGSSGGNAAVDGVGGVGGIATFTLRRGRLVEGWHETTEIDATQTGWSGANDTVWNGAAETNADEAADTDGDESEATARSAAEAARIHLTSLVEDGQADETVVDSTFRATVNGGERSLFGQQSAILDYRSVVSEPAVELREAFGDDERVTVRYALAGEATAAATTDGEEGSREWHTGMAVYHAEDGELVEGWHVTDAPGVAD